MTAANTYHSLNEHRLFTDAVYQSGSSSKLISGALVVAIFLGVGTYFYTSTTHDSAEQTPVSGEMNGGMNYETPAITEGVAPADTMQSAPAPDASTPSQLAPDTNSVPPVAPAQGSTMNRAPAAPTTPRAPAPPPQTIESPKPETSAPIDRVAPAPADNGAVTPDMSMTAPDVTPSPSASEPATEAVQDPVLTEYDAPAAATDADAEGSVGG